ncbi:MAG: hypothetical protein SGI88_12495 [Candidatus Hydrogenedentes bacterium]|nr:hypothetical protein [Candidatus Hydrogenedentota bacterium]
MSLRLASLILVFAAPFAGIAQDPPETATAPDEAAEATAAPAEISVEEEPQGDVITLNNGHEYRGLQVIRSTASEIILEVTEEVSIKVPRRQIRSVQYDNINPIEERAKAKLAQETAAAAGITLLSGQKVSTELQKVLNTDISAPPIVADKRDLVDIIGDVNKRVNNVIVVDKPVLDLPIENRQWTLTARPGMTLAMLLQEEFVKAFPDLAMLIRDEKLLLTSKTVALEILGTEGAPPSSPPAQAANPARPAASAPATP